MTNKEFVVARSLKYPLQDRKARGSKLTTGTLFFFFFLFSFFTPVEISQNVYSAWSQTFPLTLAKPTLDWGKTRFPDWRGSQQLAAVIGYILH